MNNIVYFYLFFHYITILYVESFLKAIGFVLFFILLFIFVVITGTTVLISVFFFIIPNLVTFFGIYIVTILTTLRDIHNLF